MQKFYFPQNWVRALLNCSILAVFLILSGCSNNTAQSVQSVNYKQTKAARAKSLIEELQRSNVQVIHVGETLRFIIPSDQLFNTQSANFKTVRVKVLDNIAQLMILYETTSAQVSGFTDNMGSPQRNIALSRRQAEMVVKYLWSKGIDARLIYAVGNSSNQPLANNTNAQGRTLNRRIEIYFQYVPIVYSSPTYF